MRFTAATLLLSVAIFFSNSIAHVTSSSAGAVAEGDTIDYSQIDLHTLSDDELVAICTDRGFELVTDVDDATGEPLSYDHDQYVVAAQECLKLEAEMEEFYESNPNLLNEMEEERDMMLKEQEELERQLKEAQENLDAEKEKSGGAFVKTDSSSANEEKTSIGADSSKEAEEESIASDAETVGEIKDKPYREDLLVDDEIIDLDNVNEVIEESQEGKAEFDVAAETSEDPADSATEEEKAPDDSSQAATDAAADSEVASTSTSATKNGIIVEFKQVAAEVCEKVKQDFNRVADIVVPKPMRGPLKKALKKGLKIAKDMSLQAIDMIKRYSAVLLEKGKTAYEGRKQEQEQQKEQEDNKQENDPTAATVQ